MSPISLAIAALLLVASFGTRATESLPAGWRKPTTVELADEPLRKKSPARYAIAKADFNGDGIEDEAVLLKSTKFSGEALWVWLSNGPESFKWVKLDQINWGASYPKVPLARGIEIAAPGVHAYGCFDDADDCNFGPHNQRPKLKLRDPALVYFKFESAASLFFWSRSANKFRRVWLSD